MDDPDLGVGASASRLQRRSPDSSSPPVSGQAWPVHIKEVAVGQGQAGGRVQLVVSKDSMAVGQVTTTNGPPLTLPPPPLSSTASSLTASPKEESTTVCPVCRCQVDDLSRHFAAAHTSPKPASPVDPGSADAVAAAALAAVAARMAAAAATAGPVVQLPSQPIPANALTASELQRKLLNLKEETNVHVSNLHSTMLQGATKRKSSTGSRHPLLTSIPPPGGLVEVKQEPDGIVDQCSSTDGAGSGGATDEDNALNLSVRDTNGNDALDVMAAAAEAAASAAANKRRRKQTQVPDQNKDQRYWARRLKNNQAAKRSRDMRIQREKIIFDENSRLEGQNKELRRDVDQLTTDNKELRLKMDFILEENERLKAIIQSIESQQQQQQQQ